MGILLKRRIEQRSPDTPRLGRVGQICNLLALLPSVSCRVLSRAEGEYVETLRHAGRLQICPTFF